MFAVKPKPQACDSMCPMKSIFSQMPLEMWINCERREQSHLSNPVVEARFCTHNNAEAAALFGNRDENLRLVEELLECK